MRTLIIELMRKDMPKGSLDADIKFHSSDSALWNKGDIDFSSIDWAKKAFIFAEADEDRADDVAHSTG